MGFEAPEIEAAKSKILNKLRGGDCRSIGRSDEVAQEISRSPKLFAQVFAEIL
jgi:hypothetical protein